MMETEFRKEPAGQGPLARLLRVCRDYMDGEYDDEALGTMGLFNEDLFSALKPFETSPKRRKGN